MSGGLHLLANNLPGYGSSDGKCLPCFGVSRRSVSVSTCTFWGDHRTRSLSKIRLSIPFVCNARRNPDFSRLNKGGYSRNRNKQNEDRDRDSLGHVDEPDLLYSKNGPLLPISNTSKSQATAIPGPREKEIVELFRKVQTQLRERAAVKEEKKIESLQQGGKESDTVNSLLKLLRKHSVEQGKKKQGSGEDLNSDQSEQSQQIEDKSGSFFRSTSKIQSGYQDSDTDSVSPTRPRSIFRRKSPVPQVKYEHNDSTSQVNSTIKTYKDQLAHEDSESDPETEVETKPELESKSVFPNGASFDELTEDGSDADDDEDEDEDKPEPNDLSGLKLTELRALAKSRGIKGYSRMKKCELLNLMS